MINNLVNNITHILLDYLEKEVACLSLCADKKVAAGITLAYGGIELPSFVQGYNRVGTACLVNNITQCVRSQQPQLTTSLSSLEKLSETVTKNTIQGTSHRQIEGNSEERAAKSACGAIHAEIVALQNWTAMIGKWPLYTLHTAYVTLEPCEACTKALHKAGVQRIIFRHAGSKGNTGRVWWESFHAKGTYSQEHRQ